MTVISPTMIVTALLLVCNGVALRGTGQPIIMFLDFAVALYLIVNSITHIGPPRNPARV